jgi:hypothetical protein
VWCSTLNPLDWNSQGFSWRWIRTSDFHRVRMVREPENHTPQALTICTARAIFTVFKGSVH